MRAETLRIVRSLHSHLKLFLTGVEVGLPPSRLASGAFQIFKHADELLDTANLHLRRDPDGLHTAASKMCKMVHEGGGDAAAVHAALPHVKALELWITEGFTPQTAPPFPTDGPGPLNNNDAREIVATAPTPAQTDSPRPSKLTPQLIDHLETIMPAKGDARRREIVSKFDEFLQDVSPDLSQKQRAELLGHDRTYLQK